MDKPYLIWITGLAGSGKTTLAKEIYKILIKKYPNTIHLDGDNLREILGETEDYSINGRIRTAYIYARLSNFLINQKFNVIVSTISLWHEIQEFNRKNNKNYYEIFLDVDPKVLALENKKDFYIKNTSNVWGLDIEPQFPRYPYLILKDHYKKDPEMIAKEIIQKLEEGEKK